MKKNRNKRAAAGFSLAETLMAVLILLMVSAVVATGMPMARDAYEKAVDAANAQTLLSTTATMLRAELGGATYMSGGGKTDEGDSIPLVFRNTRTGVRTTLANGSGDTKGIQCGSKPLVTVTAATSRLYTEFGSIDYDYDSASMTGTFTVNELKVMKNGQPLASLNAFIVRTVNP